MAQPIPWPEGRPFAFTIVDDTDEASVELVGPVYDLLHDLGFRTTKTVWPLDPIGKPLLGGCSLQHPAYRDWILKLQRQGFEIALHGTADETSLRDRTRQGLDAFRDILGHDPVMHVTHNYQQEALYWGADRLDGSLRALYKLASRLNGPLHATTGHLANDPRFWGDFCRDRIKYMRNYVFEEIVTTDADPLMPYHDPNRPYVRYWYSSSNGKTGTETCRLLSEENQDRLAQSGGACILYSHLAYEYLDGRKLRDDFRRLMTRLASLGGWYVPASTLLDHLGNVRGWANTPQHRRAYHALQRRWLWERIVRRNGC